MKSKEEIVNKWLEEDVYGEPLSELDLNECGEIEFRGLKSGFISGYTQCQKDIAEKRYTEEDIIKAIEKARDIFDGKDCFTAEDVSGCTEVCTYNWKFQFSEDDIINSLNKQD